MKKKKKKKRTPRYKTLDEMLLAKLCHESSMTDPVQTDEKIRRSLKYYAMDIDDGMRRVPQLRKFKNRILEQVGRPLNSSYYVRSPDDQGFAAMEDFDLTQLRDDMTDAFPSIDPDLVGGFISLLVYMYYLR